MYKMLSWTAVILWLAFIFYLSHQPASASNELSTGVTEVVVKTVEKVAPKADLDIRKMNHFVRKNAHFFAYFILGMLMMNALSQRQLETSASRRVFSVQIRLILLAAGLCVFYAVTDEMHQMFVPGRGPGLKDVLIDSAGAAVGILLFSFLSLQFSPKSRHNNGGNHRLS